MKSITIFTTRDCNFSCKYCIHKREKKYLSKTLAKKVADFAKRNGVLTVSFFGGEPLLNFNVVKYFINYCKKRNYRFKIALITNGYLLNESKVKFLAKNNVQTAISFDGKSVNENRVTVGGKSTTNVVLKNLLNATKRIKFELCSVLNRSGIDGLANDYISLYEQGVKTIKPAINEEFGDWTDDEISRLKNEFRKVLYYVAERYKKGDEIAFSDFSGLIGVKLFNVGGFINECPFGEEGVVIDDVGDMYPCAQFAFDINNKIGDIFKGIDYKKFAEIQKRYSKPIYDKCNTCSANWLCHYTCACKNYAVSLKGAQESACKYIKMKIELINELVDLYKAEFKG